jgi:tetratricopeptide (TPR) repeat protein
MQELINIEPNNVKVLYLRGKAYLNKKEYENAYEDFCKAASLEPEN